MVAITERTPRDDGFFMPAEWYPHNRCWMSWVCKDYMLEGQEQEARQAYADTANAISQFEPVVMLANKEDEAEARRLCGNGVSVQVVPIDDAWLRDNGPTFLINNEGGLAAVNWQYNCWGEKYVPWDKDAAVPQRILDERGVARYVSRMVCEGGGIHVDGDGTLLVTETVQLNPNRNPGLSKSEVEEELKSYLGCSTVIWLAGGCKADWWTDGHVDALACFAKPGVVAVSVVRDPTDPDFEILQENARRLRTAKDARGRALEVVEIEQAEREDWHGEHMLLSYINFYIANGGLIVPAMENAKDEQAYETLSRLFPNHRLVKVSFNSILRTGGGIHCITQQEPVLLVSKDEIDDHDNH